MYKINKLFKMNNKEYKVLDFKESHKLEQMNNLILLRPHQLNKTNFLEKVIFID